MGQNRQMNVIFSKIWLGVSQAWCNRWFLVCLDRHAWAAQSYQMVKCYLVHTVWVFFLCVCWWCMLKHFWSEVSQLPILCHTSASTCWDQLHVSSPPLIPAETDETVTLALASRAACLQKVRNINVTRSSLQTLTVMKPLCSPHCFCVWWSVLETLQEFTEKVSKKGKSALCCEKRWTLRTWKMFCKPVAELHTSLNELFTSQSIHWRRKSVNPQHNDWQSCCAAEKNVMINV